jgi:NAD(P)-dependent dehydrogenase (short-subunit alcohol dehydrogenase family)
MSKLARKVVVVTGGGGLLGEAFSKQMAVEGAHVLVNDVDGARAEAVAEEIVQAGGSASAFEGSVDSWDGAGRIVDACIDRYDRIDCLVNGAHAYEAKPIAELSEAEFRLTLDSHVTGHFACTHHATKYMIRQGGGSVVNLLSRAMQGLRGFSAYGAAKGAILSATFSWALELAEHGIRVNAVSPAARRRESGESISLRMPWRRGAGQSVEAMRAQTPTPESVAPLVVFLASDASDWISGQAFFLAGDSFALIQYPKEGRVAFMPEGWNVETLEAYIREDLAPDFEHPSMGSSRYAWYDGLGSRPVATQYTPT